MSTDSTDPKAAAKTAARAEAMAQKRAELKERAEAQQAELREQMAAKQGAMQEQLAARKEAARASLDARKAELEARKADGGVGPRRERKRPWGWMVLSAILALLLLRERACAPPPEEPEECPPCEEEVGEAGPAEPEEPGKPPRTGRVDRRARPAFETKVPEEVPWITSFRMQVAARSPRLSRCFEGAEEPGSIKWTTSVEPGEGLTSEHELEPTLDSAELTRAQKACVIGVLTDPPYTLEVGEADRGTPVKVGLVLEF